jgi:hypothetical protein
VFIHEPVGEHVWTFLLSGVHCMVPGVHATHMAFRQTGAPELVQSGPMFIHPPSASHACGCVPLHWVVPGEQVTQEPNRQTVQFEPLFSQLPVAEHTWGCVPLH